MCIGVEVWRSRLIILITHSMLTYRITKTDFLYTRAHGNDEYFRLRLPFSAPSDRSGERNTTVDLYKGINWQPYGSHSVGLSYAYDL
jgi:hypothetical protein